MSGYDAWMPRLLIAAWLSAHVLSAVFAKQPRGSARTRPSAVGASGGDAGVVEMTWETTKVSVPVRVAR